MEASEETAVSSGHSLSMTIAEAIRNGALRLQGVVDNPRLECRVLLAYALGVTQNDLIRDSTRRVGTSSFDALVARRLAREPIALILGHREFWSMDFEVSAATLIPRADSETLVRAALAHYMNRAPPKCIIDLGTGTGCLLLALLREFPTAFGIGIDVVPAAASLARRNAGRLGLAPQAAFLCGDWTSSLYGRFDLIIANPPYVASGDIACLMPEVRHEPRSALDGGSDGCDAYRTILPRLPALLTPDGIAVLELGAGQAKTVTDLARKIGLRASLHSRSGRHGAGHGPVPAIGLEKTVWQRVPTGILCIRDKDAA